MPRFSGRISPANSYQAVSAPPSNWVAKDIQKYQGRMRSLFNKFSSNLFKPAPSHWDAGKHVNFQRDLKAALATSREFRDFLGISDEDARHRPKIFGGGQKSEEKLYQTDPVLYQTEPASLGKWEDCYCRGPQFYAAVAMCAGKPAHEQRAIAKLTDLSKQLRDSAARWDDTTAGRCRDAMAEGVAYLARHAAQLTLEARPSALHLIMNTWGQADDNTKNMLRPALKASEMDALIRLVSDEPVTAARESNRRPHPLQREALLSAPGYTGSASTASRVPPPLGAHSADIVQDVSLASLISRVGNVDDNTRKMLRDAIEKCVAQCEAGDWRDEQHAQAIRSTVDDFNMRWSAVCGQQMLPLSGDRTRFLALAMHISEDESARYIHQNTVQDQISKLLTSRSWPLEELRSFKYAIDGCLAEIRSQESSPGPSDSRYQHKTLLNFNQRCAKYACHMTPSLASREWFASLAKELASVPDSY